MERARARHSLLRRDPQYRIPGEGVQSAIGALADIAEASLRIRQQLLFSHHLVAVQHQPHQVLAVLDRTSRR